MELLCTIADSLSRVQTTDQTQPQQCTGFPVQPESRLLHYYPRQHLKFDKERKWRWSCSLDHVRRCFQLGLKACLRRHATAPNSGALTDETPNQVGNYRRKDADWS